VLTRTVQQSSRWRIADLSRKVATLEPVICIKAEMGRTK
jgi:hypothetical protein